MRYEITLEPRLGSATSRVLACHDVSCVWVLAGANENGANWSGGWTSIYIGSLIRLAKRQDLGNRRQHCQHDCQSPVGVAFLRRARAQRSGARARLWDATSIIEAILSKRRGPSPLIRARARARRLEEAD